ncbi:hypothetical protein BKA82DRAFT_4203753, partial [Pisolithus tinctorius]
VSRRNSPSAYSSLPISIDRYLWRISPLRLLISIILVVPVQPVECTPPVASRSKRLTEAHGLHGQPSKRTRFEDMTSKVMQLSLSESRGMGRLVH